MLKQLAQPDLVAPDVGVTSRFANSRTDGDWCFVEHIDCNIFCGVTEFSRLQLSVVLVLLIW